MLPGFLITVLSGSIWAVDISTHYLGTGATYWNLPDTGQTTSYTDTFGEDHDYPPADSQPSYTAKTISGGDVVVDNRTGLMWVQDPETDLPSPWPGTMNWQTALSACEGLTFAGYDDWRLPNVKELFSIVEEEGAMPFINAIFTCESTEYWSSTTYVPDTDNALYVYFTYGNALNYGKFDDYYIRPVRGGP